MSDIRVASRYARSLFELALEKGSLEEVHNDMQLFAQTVRENRELLMMLKNPIIKSDKKLKILEKLFSAKVNELTMAFFRIIARKGRESQLPLVAEDFHRRYNSERGIIKAEVVTTIPVTTDMRKEFKALVAKITGKETELIERIDKNLIGGYILRVGDQQIDESISSRLEELKNEFSHNPYVKEF